MVKRYFGRGKPIWKANPIALWTEADIWEYHRQYQIPHCALYDKGYGRNGCWTCAMAIRNGQLRRLRETHPDLYRRLVIDSDMGAVLLHAKCVVERLDHRELLQGREMSELLRERPDFFDTIKWAPEG